MQLQGLLIDKIERMLKEMKGLTWSRIRRLNSSRKYKAVYSNSDQKIYEKAACMTVGSFQERRLAYGMAESKKGMMAVLVSGNVNQGGKTDTAVMMIEIFQELFHRKGIWWAPKGYFQRAWKEARQKLSKRPEDLQSLLAVSILVRGQKLWYDSSGSFKAIVCRNKKLFMLPSGHRQGPLLLNRGDYVVLMSPGLYRQVKKADIEDCLNQNGSCEEKALRLVNLFCQGRKREGLGSAVVVMGLK